MRLLTKEIILSSSSLSDSFIDVKERVMKDIRDVLPCDAGHEGAIEGSPCWRCLMQTVELNLKSIESVHITEDGVWFYFDSDGPDMMKLVVLPDESNYSYSHGGKLFREAMEVIHEWKESTGFGVTE